MDNIYTEKVLPFIKMNYDLNNVDSKLEEVNAYINKVEESSTKNLLLASMVFFTYHLAHLN